MLSGVPGVRPGKVVILGGGTVGSNAAKIAVGLGADVTLLDINPDRLRYLDELYQGRLKTLVSNPYYIAQEVEKADLLIGAVLIPGAKAPCLVSEEMVKTMEAGSVIVDVAIDQGGSIETIDRKTTHDQLFYIRHGVLHYAVPDMPGAVSRTSTAALSNVTLPYVLELARKGCRKAASDNGSLARGINVVDGSVTYQAVAEAHGYPFVPLDSLLNSNDIKEFSR